MSEQLQNGRRIKTLLDAEVVVGNHLGGGGQGDVYIVSYNGQSKALKWYKPNGMGQNRQAFYENLKNNVMKGIPSPEFLWPIDVTEWEEDTFGYIMNLVPDGYYEMSEYLLMHVRMPSFKVVIDAALHIVSAFRILHNNGYSYQDLNDGNFFIEPQTGKVFICDNDNVAPNKTDTGILGKPRYMAPESVVRKSMPDNLSDRFSMSLILYRLFCLDHPLEGKRSLVPCLSPELQEELYGSEALFMMDPDNTDNAPDPVIHKNSRVIWPCLPDYIRDLFLKAFSQKSMTTPNARPKELDWINALVRFRSDIVPCSCGNEIFTQQGKPCKCDRCGRKPAIPFRLEFPEYTVPGIKGTRIYRCQAGTTNAAEALRPMGRVLAKTDAPAVLGLKNLSESSWNAVTTKGKPKKVMPGDVIPLKDGIKFTVKSSANDTGTEVTIRAN